MKIGFICDWAKDPRKTWSYTPWNLRESLSAKKRVIDISPNLNNYKKALKLINVRRRNGHFVTEWRGTKSWDIVANKVIDQKLKHEKVDSILMILDTVKLKQNIPYYIYQDLSYSILEYYYDKIPGFKGVPGFSGVDLDYIRTRKERENEILANSTKIFAMSQWMADSIVKLNNIPANKIHVIHAGQNTNIPKFRNEFIKKEDRNKLLFIGVDFFRKGGDMVVEAVKLLRKEYNFNITLTVAGPQIWPLGDSIPEGINFLGNVPSEKIEELLKTHDLFVMPSHFEAFGIVFVEALSYGLPCVGRNSFAMPEIIKPGVNGELIAGNNHIELAEAIIKCLENDNLYKQSIAMQDDIHNLFSWETKSNEIIQVMEKDNFRYL